MQPRVFVRGRDVERPRGGPEQGAHPGGSAAERALRPTAARAGNLLRYRTARDPLRTSFAEHHLAAHRVRARVPEQVTHLGPRDCLSGLLPSLNNHQTWIDGVKRRELLISTIIQV